MIFNLKGAGWRQLHKTRRGRKPVSVFESAIYLRNLPPDIGRAALICQYIWSCRPCLRTRTASLTSVVGSYPAFSPLPSGGCFLLRCHKITPIWAFPSRVPCPVRTFLTLGRSLAARQIVPPFHIACKYTEKLSFFIKFAVA